MEMSSNAERSKKSYNKSRQDINELFRRVNAVEHDVRNLIMRFDNFLTSRQEIRFPVLGDTRTISDPLRRKDIQPEKKKSD